MEKNNDKTGNQTTTTKKKRTKRSILKLVYIYELIKIKETNQPFYE